MPKTQWSDLICDYCDEPILTGGCYHFVDDETIACDTCGDIIVEAQRLAGLDTGTR